MEKYLRILGIGEGKFYWILIHTENGVDKISKPKEEQDEMIKNGYDEQTPEFFHVRLPLIGVALFSLQNSSSYAAFILRQRYYIILFLLFRQNNHNFLRIE